MTDINGFNGLYALTKDGQIWSYGNRGGANHNGKFINSSNDRDGYRRCTLRNHNGELKYFRIGRLMLQTFNPTTDTSLQANHKNGIRSDDRIDNLEWVTPSENIKHSFDVLSKNQKCSKNNAFVEWGFYDINGELNLMKDKSVDTWCIEQKISSTAIYFSMKNKHIAKRGKLKGLRFFRIKEEFGSTN